jgi:hypothetical protein
MPLRDATRRDAASRGAAASSRVAEARQLVGYSSEIRSGPEGNASASNE